MHSIHTLPFTTFEGRLFPFLPFPFLSFLPSFNSHSNHPQPAVQGAGVTETLSIFSSWRFVFAATFKHPTLTSYATTTTFLFTIFPSGRTASLEIIASYSHTRSTDQPCVNRSHHPSFRPNPGTPHTHRPPTHRDSSGRLTGRPINLQCRIACTSLKPPQSCPPTCTPAAVPPGNMDPRPRPSSTLSKTCPSRKGRHSTLPTATTTPSCGIHSVGRLRYRASLLARQPVQSLWRTC